MNSATTAVAVHYRLKERAEQIRECQNRPAGMSVVDWCASHGITKADYYYRLRRVRQVCLENLPPETPAQQIVPVPPLPHASGNTSRYRYTAGAFCCCKRSFHPRNRIHTHAVACGSP